MTETIQLRRRLDNTIKESSRLPSKEVDLNLGAIASTKNVLLDYFQDDYSTQNKDKSNFVTYYSKDSFRDAWHVRSGKYYLPEAPNYTVMAQRSGLLFNLITKVYVFSCGATFQWCFPEVPMLGHGVVSFLIYQ